MYRNLFRYLCRTIFLILGIICLFAGPVPGWLDKIFSGGSSAFSPIKEYIAPVFSLVPTSLSPFSVLQNLLHGFRASWLYFAFFIIVAGLLTWAFFKGRIFCTWICPMGTLHGIFARFSLKKHFFKYRINGYIFWIFLGGIAVGVPFMAFFDPMVQFTKLNVLSDPALMLCFLLPLGLLIFFLLVNFIQPLLWCSYLCPAGYLFGALKKKAKKQEEYKPPEKSKRELIAGLFCGAAAGLILPKILSGGKKVYPVLPPGSCSADEFAAKCLRCYSCINVCPSGIITVKHPWDKPLVEWFEPELDPEKGVCEEHCSRCTTACPTGVIKRLSPEEKHNIQIGIAEVEKDKCIAWHGDKYCFVCAEYCPYGAIISDKSNTGVPRPKIDPEKCRGCGFCQNSCPAPGSRAIVVKGIAMQRVLKS